MGSKVSGSKVSAAVPILLASHHNLLAWLPCFSLLCSDPADMNGCGAHLIGPLLLLLFSFPFNYPGFVGQPGTASMLGILQFCCSWSSWRRRQNWRRPSRDQLFCSPPHLPLALLAAVESYITITEATERVFFLEEKEQSLYSNRTHACRKS